MLAVAAGCFTLAFSCNGKEQVLVTPASTAVSVAPGSSATVTFQLSIPDRQLKSLRLPVDVQVVGADSVIPPGVTLSGDPDIVSISERGTRTTATVRVDVAPGTPPNSVMTAIVVPSPLSRLLEVVGTFEIRIGLAPAPLVTITSPAPGSLVGEDTVPITATVSDADNNFLSWQILLDDGELAKGTNADPVESEATGLESDSKHTVEVRAQDRDGNEGNDKVTFTVDLDPPTVTLDTPADGESTDGVLDVTGAVEDTNIASWAVLLDADDSGDVPSGGTAIVSGTANDSIDTPLDTATLAEGLHTLTLTADDKAGHNAFVTVTFIVDRTTGTVAITRPAEGHLYVNDSDQGASPGGTTVVGQFTAQAEITAETLDTLEAGGVVFTLGGQDSAAGSLVENGGKLLASKLYSSVPNGSTTLTVQFTDKAGHASTPASISFTGVAPPAAP